MFQDNQKFEFENDIYSGEFFDFVKGILQAVAGLDKVEPDGELMQDVKKKVLKVGKRAILDLLAKCFYNTPIKFMVETLCEIMERDPRLCREFMEQCWQEDQWAYLFEVLLECTDSTARQHVGMLLKFVFDKLKLMEKDCLYLVDDKE